MTTILVATDFSGNAHWATNYALEVAHQLHARLVLIHAYEPFTNGIRSKAERSYEQTLHQLNQLREQMLQATNRPVDISVVARTGSPAEIIIDEATKWDADLLVMGVTGDELQQARRLGSLATEMIPHTQVPMLLVPPGSCYQLVDNIVMAVDLLPSVDTLSLASASRFVQLFNATLDIICIANEPDEHLRKATKAIRNFLSSQPHTFSFLPGSDLITVLNNYCAEHKADLIMLLPKSHNRLRTFLPESDTQEVVCLTKVPVLAAV
ncbi:universal stress protein [Spirosoma flavum]|uniref:Universal stress protein n=1 Tax=Spirosoma flavum TaxID=2048557 RepID=A0ABW6AMH4_9BACT